MLSDYTFIAQRARFWATNQSLSMTNKALALKLAELAEILRDPFFGCATEHFAAEVMYCHLCKAIHNASSSSSTCPGDPDCPTDRGISAGSGHRCVSRH